MSDLRPLLAYAAPHRAALAMGIALMLVESAVGFSFLPRFGIRDDEVPVTPIHRQSLGDGRVSGQGCEKSTCYNDYSFSKAPGFDRMPPRHLSQLGTHSESSMTSMKIKVRDAEC